MGDLSKNFNRHEFACHCGCGFDAVNPKLITALETLRELCGNRPITITSGCRCVWHNKAIGGVAASKHLLGDAADIKVQGKKAQDVLHKCGQVEAFKQGGRILYDTWVHVDVNTGNGRPCLLDKRSKK
jgi:uncharacterized protein YcbK (DUF882 family)